MISIPIDIYSYTIKLAINKPDLPKAMRDTENDFMFVESGDSHGVLLCSNLWGDIYNHYFLQCLTHECNHAAMCILGIRGVPFSYENQEALCYLQDYIFTTALNKIKAKL